MNKEEQIDSDTKHAKAFLSIARGHLGLGDIDEAIEALKEAEIRMMNIRLLREGEEEKP